MQVMQTLQAMHGAPPDDNILNQCKLCHLVAQFATDASGSSQPIQVVPSDGKI